MLVTRLSQIDQLLRVAAVLGRDHADGNVPHVRKVFEEILGPICGGRRLGSQIPFVNDEYAWFVFVVDFTDQLLVDLRNRLQTVEKHQDDVGATDASFGSRQPVPFDIIR